MPWPWLVVDIAVGYESSFCPVVRAASPPPTDVMLELFSLSSRALQRQQLLTHGYAREVRPSPLRGLGLTSGSTINRVASTRAAGFDDSMDGISVATSENTTMYDITILFDMILFNKGSSGDNIR